MLAAVLRRWRSWLFPHECDACGRSLSDRAASGLCPDCARQVVWLEPPQCPRCAWPLAETGTCARCARGLLHVDAALAVAAYAGPMKKLLHAYKFGGRRYLASLLSREVWDRLRGPLTAGRWDAVAAVPLESGRLARRGFNQSRLVARRLGRRLGLPDWSSRLRRRPGGRAQAGLDRHARESNVSGRFVLGRAVRAGARVLLVDDVFTTGRTASECARVLKDGGASHVTVLALARGL